MLKIKRSKFSLHLKFILINLFFASLFVSPAFASTKGVFTQYKDRLAQIRIVDKTTNSKTTIGSGFFVNDKGLIATNYHVISKHVFEPNQYRIEFVLHDRKKTK